MSRLTFVALGILAVPCFAAESSAEAVARRVHERIVSALNDLEATKDGMFGTSRIEVAFTKGHPVRNLPEASRVNVTVWANKGKPLDASTMEIVYRRFGAGTTRLAQPDSTPKLIPTPESLAREALARARKGDRRPLVETQATRTWVARTLDLTKRECLKCHGGMKVGDPIAVVVYRVNQDARS